MSNIHHHSANGREYLIVQVPIGADASYFPKGYVNVVGTIAHVPFIGYLDTEMNGGCVVLPAGNYTILFIVEQATGLQAHSVVEESEGSIVLYKDYEGLRGCYATNTESLMSLIRANFPNHAEMNHIVLLKNKEI